MGVDTKWLAKQQEARMNDRELYEEGLLMDLAKANDRIEALEAKLAKAVEALDSLTFHACELERQLTEDLFHQDFCGESVTLTSARTTLAELKGEK